MSENSNKEVETFEEPVKEETEKNTEIENE